MKFRKFEWTLSLRILLLLAVLSGIALLMTRESYTFAGFLIVMMVFQVVDLFRFTNKSNVELQQFVESVHYRDFSRRFDEKNAPASLQPMRKGFNEINTTFKIISKEKESANTLFELGIAIGLGKPIAMIVAPSFPLPTTLRIFLGFF